MFDYFVIITPIVIVIYIWVIYFLLGQQECMYVWYFAPF